jgi:hypothetical protein
LNQIGEEGIPFFLDGMDSADSQVRGQSTNAFPVDLAKRHAADLTPRLRRLLRDEVAAVRADAAALIHNAELRELAADVESALAAETDASARRYLQTALNKIRNH